MSLKSWFSKNAGAIFSGFAIFGVAATAVLTYIGTVKAEKTIREWTEEKHEELTTFEKVQASCKPLLPAVGAAIGTMACVVKAQTSNSARVAAATGIAAIATKKFSEYKEANIEVNGIDAHEKVMARIVKADNPYSIQAADIYGYCDAGSWWDDGEKHTFYDSITDQYFESTLAKVIDAELNINRNFALGRADVPMWCEFLGIPNPKKDLREWTPEDVFFIDFNNAKPVVLEDGLEVCIISCLLEPQNNFDE